MFVVVVDDDDVVIAFNCWWGDLFFIEPRGFYAERARGRAIKQMISSLMGIHVLLHSLRTRCGRFRERDNK